jgi:site-specific DNA recombinase
MMQAAVAEVRGDLGAWVTETVAAAKRAVEAHRQLIEAEVRRLESECKRLTAERANLVAAIAQGGTGASALTPQLGETAHALQDASRRADEQRGRLASLEASAIDEQDLRNALDHFDSVWGAMTSAERARVLRLLIEVITFDGRSGEVSITFRHSGVRLLASEVEQRKEA